MQRFARTGTVLALVGFGYLLGTAHVGGPGRLQAQQGGQQQDPAQPSIASQDRVRQAADAVAQAAEALGQEARYIPATEGLNSFVVLSGGANAMDDLESGRGVDPVTFAGLYADMAVPEVAEHLEKDAQGRLTYKGKVVRMYPVSRLRAIFEEQARLRGEE